LNLDLHSTNANTLSLFREGDRISEPMPIPECLHGKVLYPHVSFRNVTVHVLAGAVPAKSLPFKCRTIMAAAKDDIVVSSHHTPNDGKYDVLLPVALPDEGTFDWLDGFIAKNPHYVELSDRKILEWAATSGLWKPKATGWKTSNDKLEFNFGLPGMDDRSIRRVLRAVAPVVPRHYIVMEVKSNLLQSERKEILKRFSAPHFRKTAHVVMGEPSEEFKRTQLDKLLKAKQDKADIAWRAKKAEDKRKKEIERRQKELANMRKKADEMRRKAAEESRKKADEARRKAEEARKKAEDARTKASEEAAAAGVEMKAEEGLDETKDEDDATKMEVDDPVKDEAKDEDGKQDPKEEDMDESCGDGVEGPSEHEEEEEEAEPPRVELTPEEQQRWFRPAGGVSDLTSAVMNQFFGSFSIPESSEGFDAVNFEWQDDDTSREYLRKWVLEKKRTSRIDALQPGPWFQERVKEWAKVFAEWQAKQKSYKTAQAQTAKESVAQKKNEDADAKGSDEGEAKEDEFDVSEEAEDVDIYTVGDVCDVGNGVPLFKDFAVEDWALLQLRFELYTLQLAYQKDVGDPERVGIHETHLAFYYNKYFRKTLTPKHFGAANNVELTNLVRDSVMWDEENKVLTTPLAEEVEDITHFMKLTEEQRRERQRRIDAGDETARLKFSPLALQASASTISKAAAASGPIRPQSGAAWASGAASAKQWTRPAASSGFAMTGRGGANLAAAAAVASWVGGLPSWGAGRRW